MLWGLCLTSVYWSHVLSYWLDTKNLWLDRTIDLKYAKDVSGKKYKIMHNKIIKLETSVCEQKSTWLAK